MKIIQPERETILKKWWVIENERTWPRMQMNGRMNGFSSGWGSEFEPCHPKQNHRESMNHPTPGD